MELLGRSLQRFVLDLTESLRNPQQNLYSIHSEIVTDFFQKYRWFTEYLRRNTCTTLTHRHRCPHRNLTGSPQNPPRIITSKHRILASSRQTPTSNVPRNRCTLTRRGGFRVANWDPAQRFWRASRLRAKLFKFNCSALHLHLHLQCNLHLQCILQCILHSAFCMCFASALHLHWHCRICNARHRSIASMSLKHHL